MNTMAETPAIKATTYKVTKHAIGAETYVPIFEEHFTEFIEAAHRMQEELNKAGKAEWELIEMYEVYDIEHGAAIWDGAGHHLFLLPVHEAK